MGEPPSGAWARALEPGSKIAHHFEELLRQRIDRDYELDEALVSHILDQLRKLSDQQQLQDDLVEVFDADGAESMASWCWDSLRSLTSLEPSEPGTPPVAPGSASPAAAPAEQQDAQQSKRAPIRFSLTEETLPEIAPKKASGHRTQQLGAQTHRTPEAPVQQAAAAPPAAAAAAAATDRPTRAGPGSSGSGAANGRQRAAPGASARMLHMTGLIRPADASSAGSSREGRSSRPRQQECREVDRTRQHMRQEEQHGRDHHHQQQQPQQQHQRKRALDEEPSGEAGRAAAGSRRAAGAAAGPGSVFRSAMDTLKSERATKPQAEEQSPSKPPQKQRAATSVFDRINKADLERLGVPQAQQHTQEQQRAQQAQRQRQGQQQQQGQLPGLPKSLQSRLGISGRISPAAAAPQQSGMQVDQSSAPVKPARTDPPAPAAVGTKRKAISTTEAPPAAGTATAPSAKPADKTAAASSAAAHQEQQQQGRAPEEAPAKKSRNTAVAPAATAAAGGKGSSTAAELAALRAQLEARQAEVQRLKQVQESDHCSVVVFGVSPRVPDSVAVAHFSGCGSIKRCSLLPGRLVSPTAPGAYIEFQGSGAAAGSAKAAQQAATKALRLSGTMMLDQKITVTRKSDWKANQAKGQRAYTAVKAAAVQLSGPGHRSWKGPAAAGGGGSTAGLDVPPAAGVAES